MCLPGVTILLQVHHHVVLYVSARGENPSTSTSPYCTLRLCPGSQSLYNYITILFVFARIHNPSTTTSPYCTLRLCPGSQSFYKYITILYFASLPRVTKFLQVHHHIVLYVSVLGAILPQVHHHTLLYVSVRGHNHSTSTSPYCTLRLCPGSQSFNKYITILYYTSLPRVTIPLKAHHHTVLYDSARGHNHSTSTSPHYTQRLCPGSQTLYKYITILYVMSLPGITIILQVHHHVVLYVSARGENPSTCTSPYCTLRLCPRSQTFYKYITILYLTSLSWAQSFYKYITILYYTSLSGVTILLQVHHHTVLYVSARGHNLSTSTSP